MVLNCEFVRIWVNTVRCDTITLFCFFMIVLCGARSFLVSICDWTHIWHWLWSDWHWLPQSAFCPLPPHLCPCPWAPPALRTGDCFSVRGVMSGPPRRPARRRVPAGATTTPHARAGCMRGQTSPPTPISIQTASWREQQDALGDKIQTIQAALGYGEAAIVAKAQNQPHWKVKVGRMGGVLAWDISGLKRRLSWPTLKLSGFVRRRMVIS